MMAAKMKNKKGKKPLVGGKTEVNNKINKKTFLLEKSIWFSRLF